MGKENINFIEKELKSFEKEKLKAEQFNKVNKGEFSIFLKSKTPDEWVGEINEIKKKNKSFLRRLMNLFSSKVI
jgi:hypothetical protein